MQQLNIFGSQYDVYDTSCCSNSNKRTLYIEVNNICNAKCSFGCSRHLTQPVNQIDIKSIFDVIDELTTKHAIDKIAITGGEPTLLNNFSELLSIIEIFKPILSHVSLTTNATTLFKNIELLNNSCIDYLNISRHHYDDLINNSIFGVHTLSSYELKSCIKSINAKMRFNCTLDASNKRYGLHSSSDLITYIKYAANIGINNILFRQNYNTTQYSFPLQLNQTKESNKCKCIFGTIDGVNIEFRTVNVELERNNEIKHKFIRNFVYHTNQHLYGGWHSDSIMIK